MLAFIYLCISHTFLTQNPGGTKENVKIVNSSHLHMNIVHHNPYLSMDHVFKSETVLIPHEFIGQKIHFCHTHTLNRMGNMLNQRTESNKNSEKKDKSKAITLANALCHLNINAQWKFYIYLNICSPLWSGFFLVSTWYGF